MSDKYRAANNGWKDGVIAGYQSIRGSGVTPSIPSRPANHPSNLITADDVYEYFYNLGYQAGVDKA